MDEEKIYTVPLRKAYEYIRTKRTRRAVKLVKQFISKHSKIHIDDVKISGALNSMLWFRGIQKPPRKIRIKVVKGESGAKAYLIDEQIKKPEIKTEEKSKEIVDATNAETKAEKKDPETKTEQKDKEKEVR